MVEYETSSDTVTVSSTTTAMCLCAGFGGLERGARLFIPDLEPVCCVEWEAFAAEKLAEGMEKEGMGTVPIWTDLRTFDGRPWRRAVDWVLAGFPCQPFSLAGSRLGVDDPRHLWPHVARIIGEVEPDYVLLENVPGLVSAGEGAVLSGILHRLQEMDYEVAIGLFTAEEVRESHKRERVFILAVRKGVVYDQYCKERDRKNREQKEAERRGGDRPFDTSAVVALDPQRGQSVCRQPPTGNGQLDGCHSQLANNNNKRLQGHGGHDERGDELLIGQESAGISLPLYPPGPDDWDAWLECLLLDCRIAPAQSKVHLLADGLANDRAAWLRLTGNGVVDLQAAYALATLWSVIFHCGG